MPIPSPGIPSATTAISSVELHTTLNNRAFYIYSGEITVTTAETTMISINDIGKRDILFCLSFGSNVYTSDNTKLLIKNNGQTIFNNQYAASSPNINSSNEFKFIIPANTSLEVTLALDGNSYIGTVAGYGYYLD